MCVLCKVFENAGVVRNIYDLNTTHQFEIYFKFDFELSAYSVYSIYPICMLSVDNVILYFLSACIQVIIQHKKQKILNQ